MGSWNLPAPRKGFQSRLLLSRRWSSPGFGPPPLDLYSHYVNGVNENEAMMREHRKLLYKTTDGKSRAKLRAAYEGVFRSDTAASMVLAWSREKYKDWMRRQLQDSAGEVTEDGLDRNEGVTPSPALTRKTTVSRISIRSRESVVRKRSQSTMSASDTEEEKPKNIRTFWWYCGIIKALCKLGLDMQKLSMRKTEQTALSELYYVSMSGAPPGEEEEDNNILFFDKTAFARKRAACRVPLWAQNLMIRRPEERKPEEVQRLKSLFMSMRSFREKYTDEMRTKICQVVRYTRCDKGRVVLRQGHTGIYFYFIYSGSVFIQINLKDAKTGEITPSTENIIRTGDSFGELALLGDGIRSATVICREPTELCQIDKSSFLEICPDIFQQQLDEKIAFAKGFELFENWEEESVKQLCFMSQVLDVPHGRVLEVDWSEAQNVYFIMRGRISMIKEFDVNDVTTAMENETQMNEWDWEEQLQEEEQEKRRNILLTSDKGVELFREGTPTSKRFACVGTLRAGQSTDLRILSLKPVQIPSITLLSEGVRVLRIATRNFHRYAPKRHVEEYLKKGFIPLTIPQTKAIVRRYLRDLSWRTFRKCVMGTLERARQGCLVSTLPASSKGTSGWARWPGFDPRARQKAIPLSERGRKSEIDDFPMIKLPPTHVRWHRQLAKAGQMAPKMSDYGRSRTTMATGHASGTRNDRRLMLYPPTKPTAAVLRKRLSQS